MDNSSFAPLPRNNELFKEFIDVFHIKAGITRLWIRSVAHKTYGLSISALTHSIHSHELLTATPKKLNEKNPVPGKPPPLRDKKKIEGSHELSMFVSNLEDKVVWRIEILMRYHMGKKMTWPSPQGPNQLFPYVMLFLFCFSLSGIIFP
ncbi:hypothetical protein Bca101_075105 [Brassica carinata]